MGSFSKTSVLIVKNSSNTSTISTTSVYS